LLLLLQQLSLSSRPIKTVSSLLITDNPSGFSNNLKYLRYDKLEIFKLEIFINTIQRSIVHVVGFKIAFFGLKREILWPGFWTFYLIFWVVISPFSRCSTLFINHVHEQSKSHLPEQAEMIKFLCQPVMIVLAILFAAKC
jgi:hypothetical protein